jgi:glycosyltransferase involved in cell wall biosynthesis
MYCGSCLHDNALASALQRAGHDVALVPTYTPLRTDDDDVSIDRVFYGAISVYLEQRSALFRRAGGPLARLLGRRGLLRWIARGGASVDARKLGPLTLSVLQGEQGKQRRELEQLVAWLRESFRPQVVHLSNTMLLGMARRIRAELGVPVLCSVQGEDLFLDQLAEPWASRVLAELRSRARDADGFVAPSAFYAAAMAERLGLPRERMHRVGLGVNLRGYGEPTPALPERPFTVGYLARVCPEKGLHVLLDAFRLLAAHAGANAVRLRVAGYRGPRDRAYLRELRRQVADWGLERTVSFEGELDREHKIRFLQGLHVLSVPTTYREPKGRFVLEALACGVPVVEPAHGSFPELIEATRGGLLVEPCSAEDLAVALHRLMEDTTLRGTLGRDGQAAVRRAFTDDHMARATVEVYGSHVGSAGVLRGVGGSTTA